MRSWSHRFDVLRRLAGWLGPWTAPSSRPNNITITTHPIASSKSLDRPMRAWIYQHASRAPRGAVFLVPGLHYAGVADARLDRFARILADAGLLVFAPFLPDFEAMVLHAQLLDDTVRAWDSFRSHVSAQSLRAGVFSVSFGSLPALYLATQRPHEIEALTLFGAYAELDDALRFCVHGRDGRPHDPLNRPVLFRNLLEFIPGLPNDHHALVNAWKTYVTATWGRPELKSFQRFHPIANAIALSLPEAHRTLFLQTTGAVPGGEALFEQALAARGPCPSWLDPIPLAQHVRVPTHLVHGADDDVIPSEHSRALAQAFARGVCRSVSITGAYGHTGTALHDPVRWVREIQAVTGSLRAVASAGGVFSS